MAIVQCPQGHFYDDEKYAVCPGCEEGGEEVRTVSLEAFSATEEIRLTASRPRTQSVTGVWDEQKTAAYAEEPRLIAGWLVCIGGPGRGRDYRLYAGFNRIGRSMGSDICIRDPQVSGDNHCSVVYEERAGVFYLVPGKGTVTYLDGTAAQQAEILSEGSRICLGESVLELAVFCKGEHIWSKM
ncbi:MAG: FHA domain-containing protein [Lachnospiraceae bacterium]|nr:FHA domain-containing protein [Lachnospiraceae bacterium]